MRWMALLLAVVLIAGCATAGGGKPAPAPAPGGGGTTPPVVQPKPPVEQPPAQAERPKTPAEVEKALGARAREAVGVLKAQDMEKLAALAHPTLGIRFSQYGHVNLGKDVVLQASELKNAWVNKRLYQWGIADGSGRPINLGFRDYYQKFVYDVDFAAAPKVGWNESIGKGNTIDNWREAYPDGVMVEFHYPQFDPKYQGMDWRSLRLVFEPKGNQWYLVGIIHAQWTI
ncbi:MAG TPA: hypothetical protein VNT01_06715 [Symbiobacteriaceae bacterium]|nr:hypothetical protein [Symbiobacteriaceae bacterium]